MKRKNFQNYSPSKETSLGNLSDRKKAIIYTYFASQ